MPDPIDHQKVIRISLEALEREMPDRRLQSGGAATVAIGSITYFLEADWVDSANSSEVTLIIGLITSFCLAVGSAFFSANRLSEMRFLYAEMLSKIEQGEDWSVSARKATRDHGRARLGYQGFFLAFGIGVFLGAMLVYSRLT
ncbi:hypothetical protein [Hyphobacterium sp.]|uniref:hypothetical protein n=1 Tax=Hyphobacterium sp. TaxID=2004662 RepID=UPI003BA9CF3D